MDQMNRLFKLLFFLAFIFFILVSISCKSLQSPKLISQRLAVLSVEPAGKDLIVGESFKYSVSQLDENNKKSSLPILYSSNNPKVATIDNNGVVKALSEGETEIKIASQDKTLMSTVRVDKNNNEMYSGAGDIAIEEPILTNGKVVIMVWPASRERDTSDTYFESRFWIQNVDKEKIPIDADFFYLISEDKEYLECANKKLPLEALGPGTDMNDVLTKLSLPAGTSISRRIFFKNDNYFKPSKIVYDDGKSSPIAIDTVDWEFFW